MQCSSKVGGTSVGRVGSSIAVWPWRLRVLNALLDFADGIQVFVQLLVIAGAQGLIQARSFLHHGIENAAGGFVLRETLRAAAAIAEQALKYDARMGFGGVRAWFRCATKWC